MSSTELGVMGIGKILILTFSDSEEHVISRIREIVENEDSMWDIIGCAVEQIKVAIQRTFSMSKFGCFRIFLRFHSYSLVKKYNGYHVAQA